MKTKKRKAFTLIELLAVITVLGIVAFIAIPIVNNVVKEAKDKAFKSAVIEISNKVEETCQLERLEKQKITNLYTIVNKKLDVPLKVKGKLPKNGYILVDKDCNVAYSFYDDNNVASKNFKEKRFIIHNKDNAPSYGLEWKSNLDDSIETYSRTLDANDINDESVNVQVGDVEVNNVFDDFDIYKDILPYVDSFGNEFMLIPKFYISKTKKITNTQVIWNYAVSKHKLDDTYYLPSNFIDEGIDNLQKTELPYVLIGKYEGAIEVIDSSEKLVSKPNLNPKVEISINEVRNYINNYNDHDKIDGYQQYDIHIHDLLNVLFAIEFKTMNTQSIMRGYVDNQVITNTGGSDFITSSSGTISNDGHNSFHYRGIENLWGNIWKFVEGLNIVQKKADPSDIYTSFNARYYSSNTITKYNQKIESYNKLNTNGIVKESGFDSKYPFVNLPTKVGGSFNIGIGDYFNQSLNVGYKITLIGGDWDNGDYAGMNYFTLGWNYNSNAAYAGFRIVKTPIQN